MLLFQCIGIVAFIMVCVWAFRLLTSVGRKTVLLGALAPIALLLMYYVAPDAVQQSISDAFNNTIFVKILSEYLTLPK